MREAKIDAESSDVEASNVLKVETVGMETGEVICCDKMSGHVVVKKGDKISVGAERKWSVRCGEEVWTAKYALDGSLVAVQVSSTECLVLEVGTKKRRWRIDVTSQKMGRGTETFSNPFKDDPTTGGTILDVVWSDHGGTSQDLIFLTSKGADFYKVSPLRGQCRHVRSIFCSLVSHAWHHSLSSMAEDASDVQRLIVLGSGPEMRPYYLRTEVSDLPKFELPPPDRVPPFTLDESPDAQTDVDIVAISHRSIILHFLRTTNVIHLYLIDRINLTATKLSRVSLRFPPTRPVEEEEELPGGDDDDDDAPVFVVSDDVLVVCTKKVTCCYDVASEIIVAEETSEPDFSPRSWRHYIAKASRKGPLVAWSRELADESLAPASLFRRHLASDVDDLTQKRRLSPSTFLMASGEVVKVSCDLTAVVKTGNLPFLLRRHDAVAAAAEVVKAVIKTNDLAKIDEAFDAVAEMDAKRFLASRVLPDDDVSFSRRHSAPGGSGTQRSSPPPQRSGFTFPSFGGGTQPPPEDDDDDENDLDSKSRRKSAGTTTPTTKASSSKMTNASSKNSPVFSQRAAVSLVFLSIEDPRSRGDAVLAYVWALHRRSVPVSEILAQTAATALLAVGARRELAQLLQFKVLPDSAAVSELLLQNKTSKTLDRLAFDTLYRLRKPRDLAKALAAKGYLHDAIRFSETALHDKNHVLALASAFAASSATSKEKSLAAFRIALDDFPGVVPLFDDITHIFHNQFNVPPHTDDESD